MKNRGRIQAQGGGIEESVSWSQENPPTVADGLSLVQELESKLSKSELELRSKELEKAKNFIQNAGEKGGVDAQVSKSFRVDGTKDVRIDIEVIKGKAFISILFLVGLLFFLFK